MNDIVKAAGGALSADVASKLLAGIGQSRATTVIGGGGKPLLRLLRHGEWVYGQEDIQIEEGSLWVVNPLSLQHGFSCWTDYDEKGKRNELLGEAMAPIYEPKPLKPEPMNGFGWSEQRVFDLKCVSGEDEGTEITHKASSVGGMRAVDGLLSAMQGQLASNPAFPCPVISLEVDSYKHTKWGTVFVPIFKLEGWADMQGNMSGQAKLHEKAPQAEAPAPAPAVAPEPTQRRRRTAASDANPTAAQAPAEHPAPQMTQTQAADVPFEGGQPARTGMPRRRPGR